VLLSSWCLKQIITVLFNTDKQNPLTQEEILKQLEDSDDKIKVKALKSAILMMLGGEPMPRILMTVIRFCINTEHHEFKKLLMLFWEIVPKYDLEKKLLPEMILVHTPSDTHIGEQRNRYVMLCAMT
jgi:coatomer subunit beta